jgi:hypothetical protein
MNIPLRMHLKEGKGHKIRNNGRHMIHIGYSDKFKAWKLFDPVTKQVHHSNNVAWESENLNLNGDGPDRSFQESIKFDAVNAEIDEILEDADFRGDNVQTEPNHTPSQTENDEPSSTDETSTTTDLSELSETDSIAEYSEKNDEPSSTDETASKTDSTTPNLSELSEIDSIAEYSQEHE